MPAPAAPASHPPFNTLLRGVVKAVPSGDTLVLVKGGASPSGPPPELRVGLSSVRAAALGRADGGTKDEAGAFAAREGLRGMAVGKAVEFVLEYKVEALGGRLFGRVCLAGEGGGESLGMKMVGMGLVKVRRGGGEKEERSGEFEELCRKEEEAEGKGVGVWGKGGAEAVRPVRSFGEGVMDSGKVLEACKGKLLDGVVEYVSNGGAMKVFVGGIGEGIGDRVLVLCLSGVQCPGFRRADGGGAGEVVAMPYALNAKFMTETRLLHRDVKVSVEGADRNGMLFATIVDPAAKSYIGEDLLRAGFAKTVGWSIEMSAKARELRAAEREARDRGLGVWKGFVKPKGSDEKFVARCVEVVSGDMIAVANETTGEVRRLYLASVRAARMEPVRDGSAMAIGPAYDAKEALRRKLIGRNVSVSIAYTREPAEGAVRKDPMVFATIGRENDVKNQDVAVPMITDGLLSVVRHRGEEERSPNYELYLEREKLALEAQKGVHKPTDPGASTVMRINNLTAPDARKRSREVLASLQRGNPHPGIIEYVTAASRFRIYFPQQAMLIMLGLKAVRTPSASRKSYLPDGTVKIDSVGEPFGDEALAYAKKHFMQRDVEVHIAAGARNTGSAFLGDVLLVNNKGEKTDISKMLLDAGMGYLHESFDAREGGGGGLKLAESNARASKNGLWAEYKEPDVVAPEPGATGALADKPLKTVKGSVCEVGFGGRVFVQGAESAGILKTVESGLAALGPDAASPPPVGSLKAGEMLVAKFSADGLWYRARVLSKKADGAQVRFIDYGNEELVKTGDLRRPSGPTAFMGKPAAATEVKLADVVIPDAGETFSVEVGEYIRHMVFGKKVEVVVRGTDGPSKLIGDISIPPAEAPTPAAASSTNGSSTSPASSPKTAGAAPKATSLVEQLLESGLVRIVRKSDRASKAAYARLAEFEKTGQATRDGLWMYGDGFESDCDDDEDVQERNRSRRGGP